jgi:hypothetical protein
MMIDVISGEVCSWTIFDNPKDAPGMVVTRMFVGDKPSATAFRTNTIEEAREIIQRLYPELFCVARAASDEPQIVETWL